jgi:Transcriptional regulator, AbiEi antitoxin
VDTDPLSRWFVKDPRVRPDDVARAHGGAARWSTFRASGVSRRALADAVATGFLVRAGRGTYALPTVDPAVIAAVSVNGFLSHASAAQMWDLDLLRPPSQPHVLVANTGARRADGAHLHRVDRAQLVDTVRQPWPVATIERTLVDCARTLPFPEALAVIDSALRKGRIDRCTLRKLSESTRGTGAVAARRALAAGDGRADSVGESATRAAALDAGLPPPELQCQIRFSPIHVIFTDMAWRHYRGRDTRLAVEFDGFGPHTIRSVFIRDRHRRNSLESAGWALLEVTMSDVLERYEETGAMIRTTLELRWQNASWHA